MKRSFILLIFAFWLSISPLFSRSSVDFISRARAANVLEVNNAADSGPGTLRQAIRDAEAGDIITFNTVVFPPGGPTTIFLLSALPAITKNNLTIDASNAGVIVDGSQASGGGNGLTIEADTCTIRGMTIQNAPKDGIWIEIGADGNTIGGARNLGAGPNGQGNRIIFSGTTGIAIHSDANLVQGNYIGIDGTGRVDNGNAFNGIAIMDGASSNTIGGAGSGLRNVISGNNHSGIWITGIGSDQNAVIGNYIGTSADGMSEVANSFSGISIDDKSQANRIGGAKPGEGNLISGNSQDGVRMNGAGTDGNIVIGNSIGTSADGMAALGNHLSGIVILDKARLNRIGGTNPGEGNLISGNMSYGICISDPGTGGNQVKGNIIGLNRSGSAIIRNWSHGVILRSNVQNTAIGDGSPGGRNLIGGNGLDGVRIEGTYTTDNIVWGNYIGTNLNGTAALRNNWNGVEISDGAHNNQIKGNLLSGNQDHGLTIGNDAHHNTASSNIIGPDVSGTYSLGNQRLGGIDIFDKAHDNIIADNLISGNQLDGIAIFDNTGQGAKDNQILRNRIGLTLTGDNPLPNQADGIFNIDGAWRTLIISNTIAYNQGNGIRTVECNGHTISQNSIYSDTLKGIYLLNNCLPPPELSAVNTSTVAGTTIPNARVEFFADYFDEGRIYLGYTTANGSGTFSFTIPGGFPIPNVTATSTSPSGFTSEFSKPVHLLWTILLYLNGDNDLYETMLDTVENLQANGPSHYANVLALIDGHTASVTSTLAYSGTLLYNISNGQVITLTADLNGITPGELNMGDGRTLEAFITWGRTHYPAQYTMLSIVDHGGGWAPSASDVISDTNTLGRHKYSYLAGGSGLSWDFTSEYDYIDIQELRHALASVTQDGADPLDVLFLDVCLMGMAEVAYQVKDYAGYFASSQNIGWAPVGSDGRYVQIVQGTDLNTTPQEMARLVVQSYANALPPNEHPYTISAVALNRMENVRTAVNQLGLAISQTLTAPAQTVLLLHAYTETQKIDYDSDFFIEPTTDGFVDLYDFALHISQDYTAPGVIAAANNVINALQSAVVAEAHHSGNPWMAPDRTWNLENTHGLSIFLPLGEDLELPILITETISISPTQIITRNLHLREMYTTGQLAFLQDTNWGTLIDTYYHVIETAVPTTTTKGPATGLLPPDIAPPQTAITVTGKLAAGQEVTITWAAMDTQTGVTGAALWYRTISGTWVNAGLTQPGASGTFHFLLPTGCSIGLAVRATDGAGLVEPTGGLLNTAFVYVDYCVVLPAIFK
jgi:hypothetical protein